MPRRRSHVGVPVPRDLQEALRRRRAAFFNGARDSSRSLIAEREDTDPTPESRSGNDPVKAAATAREPSTDVSHIFRKSLHSDRLFGPHRAVKFRQFFAH